MNKDRVEGKVKDIAGRVERQAGEWTDNPKTQVKGAAKQAEGKVLTILRSDIDELRNTGLSLMPVGVEKNIDKQQMADLIFWLKN